MKPSNFVIIDKSSVKTNTPLSSISSQASASIIIIEK